MKRANILGTGVVLTILGLFLFGIAYSSYQSSNTNYQACLRDFVPTYCNNNSPVISWGVPLEIVGGILTALGAGLLVVPMIGILESRKPKAT